MMSDLDKVIAESTGSFANIKESLQQLLDKFKQTALQSPIKRRPLYESTMHLESCNLQHTDYLGEILSEDASNSVHTPWWSSESCCSRSELMEDSDELQSGGVLHYQADGGYLKHLVGNYHLYDDVKDDQYSDKSSSSESSACLYANTCRLNFATEDSILPRSTRTCNCSAQILASPKRQFSAPKSKTKHCSRWSHVHIADQIRKEALSSHKFKARDVFAGKGELVLS